MNEKFGIFRAVFVLQIICIVFLVNFFSITLGNFKDNFTTNNIIINKGLFINSKQNLSNTNYFSKSDYSIPIQDRNKLKIGFVKPTFTDAAYNNKFYPFFIKHAHSSPIGNITTDVYLLNSKVSTRQSGTMHNVYAMVNLINDINKLSNQTQVKILTDIDVDRGKIFGNSNQLNLFDILILGHQEYVTQKEYDNLKQFVSNGGTMIALDGNIFYAEIKYNDNNNTISLVKGHGWAYNGKSAWKSVNERWKDETKEWVGSNYLCYHCVKSFGYNPFKYHPHEEQYITNPKDRILLNYNPILLPNAPKPNVIIATYELDYGKGKVISLGIYSDDLIQSEKFDKYFVESLLKFYSYS